MRNFRFSGWPICLLLLIALTQGGCWGRKFFRMPGETLDTSARVDSLLRENAILQRRVYLAGKSLGELRDFSRSANAQLKIDIEELKDQLNALQQLIRENGGGEPYVPGPARVRRPDAMGADSVGGDRPEEAFSNTVPAAAVPPDSQFVAPGTVQPGDTVPGAADTTAAAAGVAVPLPEEIHRQVYLDFSRGAYQLALEESELLLKEYPEHPLREEIHFIRGECFIQQEKHFESLEEFLFILQRYPRGRRVPAALLRMAIAYESIGEDEIAAGKVRQLIREYPYTEEAASAKERFKDLLER